MEMTGTESLAKCLRRLSIKDNFSTGSKINAAFDKSKKAARVM